MRQKLRNWNGDSVKAFAKYTYKKYQEYRYLYIYIGQGLTEVVGFFYTQNAIRYSHEQKIVFNCYIAVRKGVEREERAERVECESKIYGGL